MIQSQQKLFNKSPSYQAAPTAPLMLAALNSCATCSGARIPTCSESAVKARKQTGATSGSATSAETRAQTGAQTGAQTCT